MVCQGLEDHPVQLRLVLETLVSDEVLPHQAFLSGRFGRATGGG